jgi:uncharacterized damage-inducible protein DinB
MTLDYLTGVLVRDLRTVKRELDAYPDDAAVWTSLPGTPNTAGTLALHLAGNLRHFIGATLGGTGYVRDRGAEFSRRAVPRAELHRELDAAIAAVEATLPALPMETAEAAYPLAVGPLRVTTLDFLFHLTAHFAYHLGQLDYHRRAVTGDPAGVGAQSARELRSARPA